MNYETVTHLVQQEAGGFSVETTTGRRTLVQNSVHTHFVSSPHVLRPSQGGEGLAFASYAFDGKL